MLRLREIELFGFKSFADRTRIPLPEDLLVVVGPNGSGKSNVTDAVLWALGEQSPKTLRGHKMQDVIFAGSHRRPASGMAEVLLSFEDGEGMKVQLGRRLLRSGESAYLMDGRGVRLKDVQEFVMRYGISTQGTFLVEQGRVEALLAASAEERRLIFEEVAGIAHYKENRRSALSKLEATQGNLLRLNDIIAEVESQMAGLKRQAAKAERFIRLSEELRTRRRAFWGRLYAQLKGRREALARDLELLHAERQRRDTALAQVQSEMEEARRRLAEHESSLQDLIQLIHQKELECERAEQENKRRTEHILTSRQRLQQIASDREELKQKVHSADTEREKLQEEVGILAEAEADAEAEAERVREALEGRRARLQALEQAQEAHRQKLFACAQEHSRLSASLSRLEEDLRRQAERERRLAREEESLAAREQALEETIAEKESARQEAEERQILHRRDREEAQAEVDRLERELERAASDQASARERLAAAESRQKVLRDHERSVRSQAHAFLSQRAPEEIKSTLAEGLAGAPEELVPALSAALGELLEGYLGGRWESVPGLLGQLREAKAGQALFFLAGARQGRRPAQRPKDRGFEGWLHEAPGMPGELAALLPTVALAAGAEAARRIAESEGIPAVSREGVLVHPDGWVRGGAGGPGGASLLEHQRALSSAAEALARERSALDAAAARWGELRAALERARSSLAALAEEESSSREALAALERDLEQLEGERRRFSASRQLLEGEAAQAQEEREAWEEQREEALRAMERVKTDQAAAEREARQGEEALQEARRALETAHESVAESRARLGETSQRHKAAREALERAAGFRSQLGATDLRLVQESEALKTRIEALTQEVTAGDRTLRTLLLAMEEQRQRKGRFEEDLLRLQEELQVVIRRVREAQEALEEVRAEVSRSEPALAAVEADLRNLTERMGEVFEESPETLASEAAELPPLSEEERQEEQKALAKLEEKIQEMGAVNMLAREEYAELESRFGFLSGQRKDLEESLASLQETIRKINKTTRDRFMEAFEAVREHFAVLFREVFEGGEARLSLLDEQNPLESGVEIFAQPPGKKLQNLQLLSGGEKAMVALALLFALFRYRPQPFFILDEVDAPLDEANINRFNRLILQFKGQTQFLVVSHNKRTMELAEVLYGVSMGEGGVSRLVSVRLAEVEASLGIGRA